MRFSDTLRITARLFLPALPVLALLVACTPVSAQAPSFELGWDVPAQVLDVAGATVQVEATGLLVASVLDDGEDGAKAWSLSMSAEGWNIIDATTDGTVGALATVDAEGLRAEDGFEHTEVTTGEGNEGAISAVVLSFQQPIAVPAGDSPAAVIRLTLEGQVAQEEGVCRLCTIMWTDGRRGLGQTVDNRITYRGRTHRPALGEAAVEICAAKNCCETPTNLIIQTSSTLEVPDLFAGDLRPSCDDFSPGANTIEVPTFEGQIGRVNLYAGIVSQLVPIESGVQGWSLAVGVRGDVDLTDVSVSGTATELLFSGGFNKTEVIDPAIVHPLTGEAQGPGAVSGIVLSFTESVTLQNVGTATILALSITALQTQGEEDVTGEVLWVDFLKGSGQPVRNVITINGQTREFCECRSATLRFTQQRVPKFSRCDANNDGRLDIADPIWTVGELFRGGDPSLCQKAADCNDDGQVDLSDATFSISYQFLGGQSPPAPFPDCGPDPTNDLLPCNPDVPWCN